MSRRFLKDPDAVLDYQIDWSNWLDGDTIATSSWTVPAGIIKESDSETTEAATIWLSGGTAGTSYECVNRITTANDPVRIDDRTITIRVQER